MNPVRFLARSLTGALLAVGVLSAAAVAVSVRLFGLTVPGAIALYFVVWWTILFAVLPFGVRNQEEAGDVTFGSEPGAPAQPALREKAIWTTIVSVIVFVATVGILPLAGL